MICGISLMFGNCLQTDPEKDRKISTGDTMIYEQNLKSDDMTIFALSRFRRFGDWRKILEKATGNM